MVKVLKSGFYTTIQDIGRVGGREYGVPLGGAMDAYSSQLANALLGNNKNDAVLEVTLVGPVLQFSCNTAICITGANLNPKLNAKEIPLAHLIPVKPSDTLTFGKLEYGCRAYVAVSGGFQTELVMNSRSMFPNLTKNIMVNDGDKLSVIESKQVPDNSYSTIRSSYNLFNDRELKCFEGPEFFKLPKNLQNRLTSTKFTVSKNNNRMGYQLEEFFENNLKSILTGPVLPGTVQLTPSGKLIVLMRDGQTTGGYPRVLQLKYESINVLAQKRVGDSIRFQF